MVNRKLVLVVHNVRSAHNVGSLLRTADGLGVSKVYLTGYSPYPIRPGDERLPHIRDRVDRQIHKTALGAEKSVDWEYTADLPALIPKLRLDGLIVLALEQSAGAIDLPGYKAVSDTALIVGNEVSGLEIDILGACDRTVSIPMAGRKESFNVAAAGAMALFHLRYH